MLEPLCNIFADIRPAILSKRDFRTGFLLRTWRNLSEHLFYIRISLLEVAFVKLLWSNCNIDLFSSFFIVIHIAVSPV